MNTKEVLRIVANNVPNDSACISSLGRTSEEVFQLFPNQTLFLDSMGDIASIALGVALGVGPSHPVIAFDTDGSHLMGLSSIVTIAAELPYVPNLLLIVLDNGIYESGGGLPSRSVELKWSSLGESVGLKIHVIKEQEVLEDVLKQAFQEFLYVVVEVENMEPMGVPTKNLDGIESKYKFLRHLEKITKTKLLLPAVKS